MVCVMTHLRVPKPIGCIDENVSFQTGVLGRCNRIMSVYNDSIVAIGWFQKGMNLPSFLEHTVGMSLAHFWCMCSQLLLQRNDSLRNWLNSYSQIQVELRTVGILAAEQTVSLTCTFRPCSSHPCLDHFKIMIQNDFL